MNVNVRIATLLCTCAALILPAGGFTTLAFAQSPLDSTDFAARSIRVEPGGFMRSSKIVRGISGAEVLKLGFRTANLDTLMQVSDSALAYAIHYGRNARRASVLMGMTALTSFVPPLVVDFGDSRNDEIKWTFIAASFGLGLWGSSSQRRANRALARAVWHYNLSLHRDALPEPRPVVRERAESPARSQPGGTPTDTLERRRH